MNFSKITGIISAVSGALTLIMFLFLGVIRQIIYSTFVVKADYWIWGYVLVPLYFIALGIYLFFYKKNYSKLFIAGTTLNLIALIALIAVYIASLFIEFGFLLVLLAAIPMLPVALVGAIFLIINKIKNY